MKRILVVDDSTAIRNILKTALLNDYEVVEGENGQAGLNIAKASQIDLFLLDVNMPVMDGITCVQEIRKLPQYAKTPIIMLTTESRDEKKQEGKAAGATGWITKPCEPESLLAIIKKLIQEAWYGRE